MSAVRGQWGSDTGQILGGAVWSFLKKTLHLLYFSIYKRNTSLMLGFNRKANGDVVRNLRQTRDMTKLNLRSALAAVWCCRAGEGAGWVGIETNTL